MKKSLAFITSLVSLPLFAGTMGPLMAPKSTSYVPYVGIDIGADSMNYPVRTTDIQLSSGNVFRFSDTTLANHGVVGGIFGGVSRYFDNNMVLSLEGNADVMSNKSRQFVSDVNTNNIGGLLEARFNAKQTYALGLSLLPGYMINQDTQLFGRVGVTYGQFKVDGNAFALLQQGVNAQPFNFSETETGYQLGLGLQTTLTPCLNLRTEWIRNEYGSFTKPVLNSSLNREGDLTFSHPVSHQFKVGLQYHFD
jgi:opacity protein-like surface antigen